MNTCMNPLGAGPNPKKLLAKAKEFAKRKQIDTLSNLRDDRVYLFSGASDHTVTTRVVDQVQAFYGLAGVPAENVKYVKSVNAGHAIITGNPSDVACSVTSPPYINDCDFVQSHAILKHVYGDLRPPAASLSGSIIQFNQREFIKTPGRSSMSDVAYAYVPKSCQVL